jgi:hypothetical protein
LADVGLEWPTANRIASDGVRGVGRKRKDEPRLDLPDPHLPPLSDGDSLTDEQIATVVRYGNAGLPDALMPMMVQAVRDQLFHDKTPFPAGTEPEGPSLLVRVWDRIVLIGEKYHPDLWEWFDERNCRQNAEEKLWHESHEAVDAIRAYADGSTDIEPILWMLEGMAADQRVAGAMEERRFGDNHGPDTAELIYEWVQRCRARIADQDARGAAVAMFAAMELLHRGGFLDKREHLRSTRRIAASKGGRKKRETNRGRDDSLRRAAAGIRRQHPNWNERQVIQEIRRSQPSLGLSERRIREILGLAR